MLLVVVVVLVYSMNVHNSNSPHATSTGTAAGHLERASNGSNSVKNKGPDELEIMMLHEDFSNLIDLATKAKETRQKIEAVSGDYVLPSIPSTKLHPEQIFNLVDRMQNAHLSSGVARVPIQRGQYPITDSIMEDMMLDLQADHERGEQWLSQITKKPSKSAGIAQKYSKWQTDILMSWMIENVESPFPDDEAVTMLSQQTGLTSSQIINWTTNVRKRNRKATCEGSKKPHHFIDFLFLVNDRETKNGIPKSRKRLASPLTENPTPSPVDNLWSAPQPRLSLDCPDILEPDECISRDIFEQVGTGDSHHHPLPALGPASMDGDLAPVPLHPRSDSDELIKGSVSFDFFDISDEELDFATSTHN